MTEERDPWSAHWLGEPYLALYPDRDDRETRMQAVFARDVLTPYAKAGRLHFLDLSCGTGRRTSVLEDGLGATIGMDVSIGLALRASRREPRTRPGIFVGDPCRLPVASGTVGSAVSFGSCFGRTDDCEDDARIAGEIARVLAPGGAFLSSVFNVEHLVASLALREEKTVAGTRILIRRRYDSARRMLEKVVEVGSGEGRRAYAERARACPEHEVRARLRGAGLTVVNSWGDFDGSAFDRRRSPRLIHLATRPSSKAFGRSR